MVRMMRSCMQSILKMVNSVIGMVGIAMILYALWLIRVWERHMGHLPPSGDHPVPWFIYTFLGLGVILCVITCSGHIAAETANGFCLYIYMFFVFLLLMLEAGLTADVFLNPDWEEDFPEDPSGSFTQFKDFIRSNFEICKWIGLSIVCVQGLSFLLALILKALGPHQYYDSDDDCAPDRVPLLKNAVQPPTYVVGDPVYGSRTDAWTIRVNEKVTCFALVRPDTDMWISSVEKQEVALEPVETPKSEDGYASEF
ncbi:hypothetical protein JRO89_XS01G0174600 [Xanthoceras sorbifolium]|uniref:Tetraspanin-19 n=1 Tax=Xanthoceras sorbifolium TaxID=99658 RepID=A0ABQ8IL66_9ROSI|nr:hypothetical protein JRO89_XS01G0174200 [Xanthoceras sorbifolium]KAH7576912.1 hypothetical protein JRO89_XS01G0174600 [Xanthoceras sorbifolium]